MIVDAFVGLIGAVGILVLGPGLGVIAVIALALIALVVVSLAAGSLRRGWGARRRRDQTPRP